LLLVVLSSAIGPKHGDIVDFDLNQIGVTKNLVQKINSIPNLSWKASTEQGGLINGASLGEIKSLCGVREGGPVLPEKTFDKLEAVPDTFDSRTNWPNCPTIKTVRDQSACGTCWAFGASEAISDRYCTYKINTNLTIAAADIGFCCTTCGDGCDGGFPGSAWSYWVRTGAVDEACYAYPFPSCDHHVVNSKNPCPSNEYPTPRCPNKCGDNKDWAGSKHHGASAFSIRGEANIQNEIYQNGPVETSFNVYQDFLTYKSGVYKKTSNTFLGGHAVKFIGWGTENGVKYWLVVNSWNPNWGDNGLFKIVRGTNECGIEGSVNGGAPKN